MRAFVKLRAGGTRHVGGGRGDVERLFTRVARFLLVK